MLAVPAGAQMPTASLYNTGGSNENLESESGVEIRGSTIIPSGTEVRVLVSTVSGYGDYFRNHGVQTYLADGSTLDEFKGNVITFNTDSADMAYGVDTDVFSWPDDRIDSGGNTTIELTLMSVAGFRVDRNNATATFVIYEDDSCSNPGEHGRNGGIVYQFRNGNRNDSCVCTTLAAVRAANGGESATYLFSSSKWRTDHTDYCESSPYRGLASIDCTDPDIPENNPALCSNLP
ncbi:MAG: hypothetical protein OXD44_01100 [Gammaproteobacteria bacterium]|nr:hypothetical protein [Gammaproteobacteria bacterium]